MDYKKTGKPTTMRGDVPANPDRKPALEVSLVVPPSRHGRERGSIFDRIRPSTYERSCVIEGETRSATPNLASNVNMCDAQTKAFFATETQQASSHVTPFSATLHEKEAFFRNASQNGGGVNSEEGGVKSQKGGGLHDPHVNIQAHAGGMGCHEGGEIQQSPHGGEPGVMRQVRKDKDPFFLHGACTHARGDASEAPPSLHGEGNQAQTEKTIVFKDAYKAFLREVHHSIVPRTLDRLKVYQKAFTTVTEALQRDWPDHHAALKDNLQRVRQQIQIDSATELFVPAYPGKASGRVLEDGPSPSEFMADWLKANPQTKKEQKNGRR